MDGVNEPYENGKILNLLDPDAEKQTFGQTSQKWPNLRDENGILLLKLFQNTKLPDPHILTPLTTSIRYYGTHPDKRQRMAQTRKSSANTRCKKQAKNKPKPIIFPFP
ncbi:hypothetical protein Hanom_Chr01g00068371 [Helianthus anomalus]